MPATSHMTEASGDSWVIGALLAEFSAVLTTLGYVFTRRAFTRGCHSAPKRPAIVARPKQWLRWASDPQRWLPWARGRQPNRISTWAWERDMRNYSHANLAEIPDYEEETKVDECDKTLTSLATSSDLWWSFFFRGLGVILWWKAGCMAPVTTVAPLFLLVSLFSNMVCGPALLQEQYRSREVYLSMSMLLMVSAGAYMEAKIIKDASPSSPSPPSIGLVNLEDLKNGEIFAIAICSCVLVVAFVYYGWTALHHWSQRERFVSDSQPFDFYSDAMRGYSSAIPVLSGLLSGTTYFEGMLGLPVCKLDLKQIPYLLFIVPLAVCSLLCSLEGAQRWDCRYFVPFSSTVGYLVATFIRILLVKCQVGKLKTSPAELAFCFAIHIALVCIPFLLIDRRPAPIQLPHTLKQELRSKVVEQIPQKELKSHGTVDPAELRSTPLLEMDRHEEAQGGSMLQSFERIAMLKVSPPHRSWGGWAYETFCNLGLWVPAVVLAVGILPLLIVGILILRQHHSNWPTLIALYCAVITGSTNLRIAIFSSVARWRTRLCMSSSYMTFLKKQKEADQDGIAAPRRVVRQSKRSGGGRKVIMADPWESGTSSSEDETVPWEAVQHFVVVETGLSQSCNSEEIRGLLQSISASTMAPKQISVFFSIKNVEQARKHEQHLPDWTREFAKKLKTVELLNIESKGGSVYWRRDAETWVVSQLLERAKSIKAQDHLILVTRTTVDSWFHPEYFPAVTFAFLNTGAKRNLTIYQPPILFLKDYYSQSWLTRYACLFLAQSSLASLSDPMGMPLPKSTCTMVMALMRSIDHSWDPNLSIRPYNIGIWTKCWIGTIGRMNLQPIFLPVYRSGCNPVLDDTFTRRPRPSCICIGSQMHGPLRAQVLSVLELVHMWTALPLACCGRRESEGTLKKRRIFSLMLRSLLPFGSVFWAHWVLSTWFLVVALNALSLIFRLYHWPPERGGAFLLGVTAAVLNLPWLSVVSHVDLLKLFKHLPTPLAPLEKAPTVERTPASHALNVSFGAPRGPSEGSCCQYLCLTACSFISGPLFFFLSLVEECRLALTLTFAEESGPPKETKTLVRYGPI